MIQINSLDEALEILKNEKASIFYFSSKNCSVCSVLKPKIEEEVKRNFDKISFFEIKCDEHLEIASHFGVFSAPVITLFIEGKEFIKEGRNISVQKFINDIKRPYELFFEGE